MSFSLVHVFTQLTPWVHVSVSLCCFFGLSFVHFLFKRDHSFICFLRKLSCTSAFFILSCIIGNHHFLLIFLCLMIFWRKINTQTLSSAPETMSLFTGLSVGSSCISDFGFLSLLICEVYHHRTFQCFLSLESQISVSIPSPLGFNFLLLPLSLKTVSL